METACRIVAAQESKKAKEATVDEAGRLNAKRAILTSSSETEVYSFGSTLSFGITP